MPDDPFDLTGEDWGRDIPPPVDCGQYFRRDCLAIVEASRSDPRYFPGIASMVFTSIQQPFYSIEDRLREVARDGKYLPLTAEVVAEQLRKLQ